MLLNNMKPVISSDAVLNGLIDFSKPYVRVSLRVPFMVKEGVVVDVETTGLPMEVYDRELGRMVLKRNKVHMVSLGFLERNLLYVYGLWNPQKWRVFERVCRNLLKGKKPLYAYSCSFEECFLGFKGNWIECLEYGIGYSDWNDEYYQYRKSLRWAAYDYGLKDSFYDVDGRDVPKLWKRFVNHGNFKCLWKIIYHNMADVFRLGWIVWRKENRDGDKR